jgi:hypothetical protein
VVQLSPHHPKVKGLSPAFADTGIEKNIKELYSVKLNKFALNLNYIRNKK